METKISSQQLVMIFVNEAFEERQTVRQRESQKETQKEMGKKGRRGNKTISPDSGLSSVRRLKAY